MEEKITDKRLLKGEKTKQAIINAAMEIIFYKGKEGFTAHAISEKAGVSKAGLFHHFKNMDEIMVGALGKFAENMFMKFEFDEYTDIRSMLQGIGYITLEHSEYIMSMASNIFSFMHDIFQTEELRLKMVEMFADFQKLFLRRIEEVSKRELSDKEKDGISLSLTILMDAIDMYLLMFNDKERFQNMWNQVVNVYSEYLEK